MNTWLLAGWTMVHFLWLGTLVAAAGAVVRLACRRAAPGVRYGVSLATLAAVAALPVGIAPWLAEWPEFAERQFEPPALPVDEARASAEGGGVHRQSRWLSRETAPRVIELKGAEGTGNLAPAFVANSGAVVETEGGNPSPSPSLPGRGSGAPLARLVGLLPYVWLIGAPLTFLLLAAGLVGSGSLRRAGRAIVDGPAAEACARLRAGLRISRRVALAVVDGLAQPVLVGIVRPTILLPAAALSGWTVEELEMVLLHELAHVRRWDNLVNLVQRVIESLLFFHPCVWLASRQVRRDREECCDAVVVQHTARPEAYASLLVSVAASRASEPGRPRPRLLGTAMADHPLAGRVRRILKLEDEPMWVSRRMLGLLVMLALVSSRLTYQAFAVPEPVLAEGADSRVSIEYYAIDDVGAIDPRAWLRLTVAPGVNIDWDEEKQTVVVAAPALVQTQIAALLERSRYVKAGAQKRDAAEMIVIVYAMADVESIDPVAWLRLTAVKGVEIQWFEKNHGLVVSAKREVHKQIAALLQESRDATARLSGIVEATERLDGGDGKLQPPAADADDLDLLSVDELKRRFASAQNELKLKLQELERKMKGSHKAQFMEIQYPKLKADIQLYQSQLIQLDRDLADIEVMKQLAILSAQSPQALDEAVASEMAKDPTIAIYKEQLFMLSQQIKQLKSSVKNQGNAQFSRLQAQYAQTQQTMKAYRAKAEKEARKRLEKVPNENLRAAMIEYDVRSKYLADKKAELTKQLRDAEAEIEEGAIVDSELEMMQQEIESQQELVRALKRQIFERTNSVKFAEEDATSGDETTELPFQSAEVAGGQDVLELRLNADGSTFFDGAVVTIDQLRVRLAGRPREVHVRVSADASLPYENVVAWMDALRAAGVQEVGVTAREAEDAVNTVTPYRLGPGNTLLVRAIGVMPESPVDGTFVVEEEGTLALGPRYGRVEVAGLTVREAEAAVLKQLTDALKDVITDTPRVQVTLLKKARREAALPKLSRGADGLWRPLDAGAPSGGDMRHYQVPLPKDMGGAEAAWIAQALQARGVSAKVVSDDGKISLRIVTPALPKFKVVWESHMVGDRVQRMCRFIGPDDKDLLPSPFGQSTIVGPSLAENEDVAATPRAANNLGAGDTIVVRVLGAFPESPIDDAYMIEDEGTIALGPTYGRVSVEGMTVLEAEQAITEHLSEILTDAKVQVTLQRRTEASGDLVEYASASDDAAAAPTFLYDGKTFDQWRDQWRTELKVEKRTEAIEALAAFARAGYGREAAEALFDVAAEYDFSVIDQSAEGRLKWRVLELLTTQGSRVEPKVWLPALMERLAADNAKWQLLTEWLLDEQHLQQKEIDAETRALLLEMASDERYGPNAIVLWALLGPKAGADPQVDKLVRAAFTADDKENALSLLLRRPFQDIDRHPEQMELFFDADDSVRRRARFLLSRMQSKYQGNEKELSVIMVTLLKVLDDSKRAADHANAIRALAAMGEYLASVPNSPGTRSVVDGLTTVVEEGDEGLLLPVYVALRRIEPDRVKGIADSLSPERRQQWAQAIKGAWRAEEEQLFEPQPAGPSGRGRLGEGGGFF